MTILHIQHSTGDYERWKAMFDSDPVGRKKSGVGHYRIVRAADDPNLVMVDLELGTRAEAEAMLAALQEMWKEVPGDLIQQPSGRIYEVAEAADL